MKPRETMRRSRPWRGASMLIIDPKNSRNGSGKSGMFVPCPEQKISGLRLASSTSACFTTDQYPGPLGSTWTSNSSWKEIGRSARSIMSTAASIRRASPSSCG